MLPRRQWLRGLAALGAAGAARPVASATPPVPGLVLTPRAEVLERARAARPLSAGPIPRDLRDRLGIAHAGPKYHFTTKPILVEGAERILSCGVRVGKFWLGDLRRVYPFHSDWTGADEQASFVTRARHPYFETVFRLPFTTIVLEVGKAPGTRGLVPDDEFRRDEEEMERLAAFLYATYADKPCTFILQNWEGDWLVRGAEKDWSGGAPPEGLERLDALAAWWRARQRGVSRARAAAPAGCRCRVLHAAEVNRVTDGLRGIPVAATHALPQAPVDLVSWSSYDGLGHPVKAWHCLDLLEHVAVRDGGGKPPIMIGEVGVAETGRTEAEVVKRWDEAMGVFLARDVAWIIQWALYCNEPIDSTERREPRAFVGEELRGLWWIRPDGTTSWGGRYLASLLR